MARSALVLYASETGNAQDIAEEVGRLTTRYRFTTIVLDLDSLQLRDLLKHTIVIFAISTTGQGEFTHNARRFWKTLLSGALKSGVLRKVRFSSFGLGDSSYPKYNVAHRLLCGRLSQLGAETFCERGEGNEQHPEGHSAGFREWIVKVRDSLLDKYPLEDGNEPLSEAAFIEPSWKLQLEKDKGPRGGGDVQDAVNGHAIATVPSKQPLPLRNTHQAHIMSNARVTSTDHFQDVRLMDLRVDEKLTYGPGAVAVVYPKNFQCDVEVFINLMNWGDVADQLLYLKATGSAAQTPSPLRHFDLASTRLTLRWLLENVLDIMSIPRRIFFSKLLHFVDMQHPAGEREQERLNELANAELIDELWDYTTRPRRTVLEAMSDFPATKIPWQYCLSIIPLMRGRQFSIASGGARRQDGAGRTRIELLVAIADPPGLIIKGPRAKRHGVCTRYIASLEQNQVISIGLQSGYLDVRPSELEVPVVMIGPGTGIAPMRSLIQQRVTWAQELSAKAAGESLLGDMLFVGCRSSAADCFFADEWEHFTSTNGLEICLAFSRDKHRPRRYVQDCIREQGQAVHEALVAKCGKVYVSGSSGNMPKGVREAIVDVLCSDGNMEKESAEAYIENMEREGRYKQETW